MGTLEIFGRSDNSLDGVSEIISSDFKPHVSYFFSFEIRCRCASAVQSLRLSKLRNLLINYFFLFVICTFRACNNEFKPHFGGLRGMEVHYLFSDVPDLSG